MALFFKKRTATKAPAYEAVKAPIKTNTNPYEAKKEPVYETVKKDGGWQNVSSKDCGNIVTKAIEIANRKV